MCPNVVLTHPDSSTETIPNTISWKHEREFGKMRKLSVTVDRDAARAVTLNLRQDQIELGSEFTGRLVDVEKGGATWTLVAYSFEWDAKAVEPLPGGTVKQGDDNAIITDLINDVATWSVGSVADLTGPLSFVFNHAFRHEALRRVEKNVPGELIFNDDASVDYVASRGSDKSGSVTLSADEGNLDGEIQIKDKGRDLDATHLRVIGAHEGEAQLFATLVPDDDPDTYENRVDYTTSRWSAGDSKTWERWSNKDVADQDTIEEEAASLGDELTEDLVEATATVVGEDLALGDTVHVEKAEADLDRDMRVHRVVTRSDGPVVRDDVLLSTRTVARDDASGRARDISRFNVAFQGSSVVLQGGGSRQPVNGTWPAEIPFDYPDVEYENEATLQVRGLPYRLYSSPGDHSHDVPINITSADNAEFTTAYTANQGANIVTTIGQGNWVNATSFTPNSPTSFLFVQTDVYYVNPAGSAPAVRMFNADTGEYFPDSNGDAHQLNSEDAHGTSTFIDATNVEGEQIYIQMYGTDGDDYILEVNAYGIGPHNHLVDDTETTETEPGVTIGLEQATNTTPTDCDVIINGNTVASNIGTGQFETEVDIANELDRGQWNMIEVTSDTLGHIQATVSVDAYKQIGTR